MSSKNGRLAQRAWQIGPLAIGATLAYMGRQRGEEWLRSGLLYVSRANWAREMVTDLPVAWQVASRFVAGETIEDAIRTARELNQRGLRVTLD